MEQDLTAQQKRYDQTWEKGIASGKLHRGNLKLNISFLEKTGLVSPGLKALEIGCGIGSVAAFLAEKGCCVVAGDISQKAVEFGREKHPGLDLRVFPAEKLPFENESFDLLLSFDLLEHIAEAGKHVKEAARVLKPGGSYVFETPNKLSNSIYETLKSRSLGWRRAHPSLQSPGSLKKLLARHGLSCEFVKMDIRNEYNLNKFGAFRFLFRLIDFRKLPLALQTNLYVVARKNEGGRG